LQELEWLDSIDRIPLTFLGHSSGTYIAYECIKYLEQNFSVFSSHLVSIVGISLKYLKENMPSTEPSNDEREQLALKFFGETGRIRALNSSDSDGNLIGTKQNCILFYFLFYFRTN
jgi:hypothetical protein